MMENETIGSEFSTKKIYYLIFIIAIYLMYFFFYIGMMNDVVYSNEASKLWFYIWFGLVLGIIPFLVDLIINNDKDLPLDTISYEDNSPLPIINNIWFQIGASVVLCILLWFRIQITGQAFIKAPSFSLTIPFISQLGLSQKIISGFLSGITAGIVESMVFFGFILPTIYAFLKKQNFNSIAAGTIAVLLSAALFSSYHWWVYGYLITALWSVFVFGVLQAIFAITFRSMIPLFMTHFINNFAVNVFVIAAYVVQVVI